MQKSWKNKIVFKAKQEKLVTYPKHFEYTNDCEEELLRRGVSADHIICKRYTEMDIPENITAKQMYDELTAAMAGKGHCCLLLDEIQEIDGWEKAVNSLLESADADIYVTGSNSKLMSSEISTYLTDRYVSIPVYTLSFREYLFFFRTNFVSRLKLQNKQRQLLVLQRFLP